MSGRDIVALLDTTQVRTARRAPQPIVTFRKHLLKPLTVYTSISQAGTSGKIPFPANGETIRGGDAVDVAGYDDNMRIRNSNNGAETVGALMIRNSWGTSWGQNGYGWLPYEYVLRGLAVNWWSLINAEWIDTGNFG